MTSPPKDQLQRIAAFVQSHLQETFSRRPDRDELGRALIHADYRWQHTLRVAQLGLQIARDEGADLELTVAGCLLHDVAWFDEMENSRDHGRCGAVVARPLLVDLGYLPQQVENICHSIATHVDVKNPDTLEAKIVSDSDNIDRFGAYRILQWCRSDIDDFDKWAEKLSRRVTHLESLKKDNPLFTRTAKQIFDGRLDLQMAFFQAICREKQLTTIPQL
ncbi:MAG: HD domain-containing protein [Anaerolineales bacterium]|nr:HD domain-containing protein [Anaerolineales bacterium]